MRYSAGDENDKPCTEGVIRGTWMALHCVDSACLGLVQVQVDATWTQLIDHPQICRLAAWDAYDMPLGSCPVVP